ncbi:MAG: M1 family peptidase, partial [Flavitalea sp.]
MNKRLWLALLCGTVFQFADAQSNRWQQRVKYSMDVDVDVNTNRIRGKQKLEYTNNSPDTLRRVFYHLYWNAFQPNSMMDVRSRELGKITNNGRPDWDPRVRDRISKLKEDEIGYQKIFNVKMNGAVQKFTVHETILEVNLSKPILPGTKVTFDMDYESQVPAQVRRAGRDAANGVRYSMSQWYPKMAEYDQDGWHPNPYVAREFYGVWGDFDVKISIDRSYIIGGTGYLQNPQQIGYGYEAKGSKVNRPSSQKLTWHFNAPNVHDFMWAADPNFKHITRTVSGGRVIHVYYNADSTFMRDQFSKMRDAQKANYGNDVNKYFETVDKQWQDVADAAVTVLPYIEKTF